MEKSHRDKLRTNRVAFTRDLQVEGDLMDYLVQESVFTLAMKETILAERTRHQQASKLMDDVPRRGPKAFDVFYKGLCESGQGDLADLLKPELREGRLSKLERERNIEKDMSQKMAKMNLGLTKTGNLMTAPSDQGGYVNPSAYQPSSEVDEVDEIPEVFPDPQYEIGQVKLIQKHDDRASQDKADERITYRNKKCRVLIINNEDFPNTKFAFRFGTHIDATNLELLFENLGYNKSIRNNLTAEEIDKELNNEKLSLKDCDAFILILLSHGDNDVVYGTDGVAINISYIKSLFNGANCPALIDKPKLFFIQACQGKEKDSGYHVSDGDINAPFGEVESDAEKESVVPRDADVFVAYATTPGLVSWRNTQTGTWFIQAIIQTICKKSYKEDINTLFLSVNNLIARARTQAGRVQVSIQHTTLRKKFYF